MSLRRVPSRAAPGTAKVGDRSSGVVVSKLSPIGRRAAPCCATSTLRVRRRHELQEQRKKAQGTKCDLRCQGATQRADSGALLPDVRQTRLPLRELRTTLAPRRRDDLPPTRSCENVRGLRGQGLADRLRPISQMGADAEEARVVT